MSIKSSRRPANVQSDPDDLATGGRDTDRARHSRREAALIACGALAYAIAPSNARADTPPDQKPDPRAVADLAEMLEPIREKNSLPALAACVIYDGRMAALGAAGFRKIGSDVRVTCDDMFHLGSCTKAMTATLCARLVEDRLLAWDTPLSRYFPEFVDRMPAPYRSLTLDHLLAQRTGFSDRPAPGSLTNLDLHRLPGSPREQRQAYASMILADPPVNKPGETFLYSNRNFAIAGIIAERAADRAYEALLTERVFEPLQMKAVGFGAMGTAGRTDQPWQHRRQGSNVVPVPPGPWSDNPPVITPAGRVHCAMADWAKFVNAHIQGERGRPGIIRSETMRRLHRPLYHGDYVGGWITAERKWGDGRVLWHNGTNTQNYALVWMAPKKNFAALVATNQGGGDEGSICDGVVSKLIQEYLHG